MTCGVVGLFGASSLLVCVVAQGALQASGRHKPPLVAKQGDPLYLQALNATGAQELLQLRNKVLRVPDYEAKRTSAAEFITKDINGDAKQDKILAVSVQCTGDPVELFVVCSGNDFLCLQTFGEHHGWIDRCVRDLDGDGVAEVLAWTSIQTPGVSHAASMSWVDIWAWNGEHFEERSHEFKDFYLGNYMRTLRRNLESLSTLAAHPPEEWSERTTARFIEGKLNEFYCVLGKIRQVVARASGAEAGSGRTTNADQTEE